MKILEIRLDRHNEWQDSVQVKIYGKWRTARKKFSIFRCGQCKRQDYEFVLIEPEDLEGLSQDELEVRFPPLPHWAVHPGDILRRCKNCNLYQNTNYGDTPPYGGNYTLNGWYARQVRAARISD